MAEPIYSQRLATLFRSFSLQTARLRIRRFEPSDQELALRHEQDPRIMQYIREVMPAAELKAQIAEQSDPWKAADGEWLYLPMQKLESPEMLGIVAVRVESAERETVEVGYRLHPDYHRQGLTFEAMVALLDLLVDEGCVRKLTAKCVAENDASWHLLEKLGMQREGRLTEFSKLRGRWHDEFVYGMLGREWRERRSRS